MILWHAWLLVLIAGAGMAGASHPPPPLPPFPYEPDAESCPVEGQPERRLSPGICAALRKVKRLFDELTPAAGFSPGEIVFELLPYRAVNGYYHQKKIQLTYGLLGKHGRDQRVMAYVLAHEFGHAVQFKAGRDPRSAFSSRQMEAHADLLAAQIAARAGYPLEVHARGVEGFFGCGSIREGSTPGRTHPGDQDRWVQAFLYKDAVAEGARPEHPSGAPVFVSRDPFRPVASPAVFDQQGRLKVSGGEVPTLGQILSLTSEKVATYGQDARFARAVERSWSMAHQLVAGTIWGERSRLQNLAAEACGTGGAGSLGAAIYNATRRAGADRPDFNNPTEPWERTVTPLSYVPGPARGPGQAFPSSVFQRVTHAAWARLVPAER